jgi:hypothetical protein
MLCSQGKDKSCFVANMKPANAAGMMWIVSELASCQDYACTQAVGAVFLGNSTLATCCKGGAARAKSSCVLCS